MVQKQGLYLDMYIANHNTNERTLSVKDLFSKRDTPPNLRALLVDNTVGVSDFFFRVRAGGEKKIRN